jgi:hypothetical protein
MYIIPERKVHLVDLNGCRLCKFHAIVYKYLLENPQKVEDGK